MDIITTLVAAIKEQEASSKKNVDNLKHQLDCELDKQMVPFGKIKTILRLLGSHSSHSSHSSSTTAYQLVQMIEADLIKGA
ncbi:hypothetical protein LCGC14_0416020 [marine sediment metagenome]|uniref:Uncharacterized protein n=1 Tax=marine sediment metagenome TaxID=412755 RepID=A0A0F9VEG6_9ZZZZ